MTMTKNDRLFELVWGGIWADRDRRRLAIEFLRTCKVESPPDIVEWAESNWDTTYDASSYYKGKIKLYPWQKQVLRIFADEKVRQLTIMAPSRTAKTTLLGIMTAYNARYLHLPEGLMLENADKAKGFCAGQLYPIMASMEYFKPYMYPAELKRRTKGNMLKLPNWSMMTFGGGVPATQFTLGMACADEIDRYKTQVEELPTVQSMIIRTESYPNRKVVLSSTPGDQAMIDQYFEAGSQGHWHIRCLSCGDLWPSHVIGYINADGRPAGLQWDKDQDGEVIPESLRWVCKRCGCVHHESQSAAMTEAGEFVHRFPQRLEKSLHLGCLALTYLDKGKWLTVARQQEISGKGASREARKFFEVEFKGLPFRDRNLKDDERHTILQGKIQSIPDDYRPVLVFAGIDTQHSEGRKYWRMCTIGVESNGNVRQVEYLRFDDILKMENHIRNDDIYGKRFDLVLIDIQGVSGQSRQEDIIPLVYRNFPRIIGYVGTGINQGAHDDGWVQQSDDPRIIHFLDKRWQSNALDAIFIEGTERLYFSPKNTPEFWAEITSMKPTKGDESADFAKWKKAEPGARNDAFDALKMALICKELVAQEAFMREFPTQWAPVYRWAAGIPEYIQKRLREAMARRSLAGATNASPVIGK